MSVEARVNYLTYCKRSSFDWRTYHK